MDEKGSITIQAALQGLSSAAVEVRLATLRNLIGQPALPELYPVLRSNLARTDDREVFLSLTLLTKTYPERVHQDAALLTPQLLLLLTTNSLPVFDRVIWALSMTGEDSVCVLIKYIQNSQDDTQLEKGIWALGRNTYRRQHPALVIDTIRPQLHNANSQVRIAAVDALMNMSPLRSFTNLGATFYNFEPMYPELQAAATGLLGMSKEFDDWLNQCISLIENRAQE